MCSFALYRTVSTTPMIHTCLLLSLLLAGEVQKAVFWKLSKCTAWGSYCTVFTSEHMGKIFIIFETPYLCKGENLFTKVGVRSRDVWHLQGYPTNEDKIFTELKRSNGFPGPSPNTYPNSNTFLLTVWPTSNFGRPTHSLSSCSYLPKATGYETRTCIGWK